MTRKTQQEINYWFQDNTVKSALDLSLIEKVLHNNNLDIPNNIIINKNGNTYDDFAYWYCDETKISKYPTSYEECVRIAKNIHGYDIHIDVPAYGELMESFVKLLICRDAYWTIAGEELGLGKPWKPDWNDYQTKYGIEGSHGTINKCVLLVWNRVLSFPTEEMRDEFYNNFKNRIVACKTLL